MRQGAAAPRTGRVAGVCAATLTPLDIRHEPDLCALVAHCRRLLANGCDAINLLGSTGEATSLSVAARLRVMEAVATSDLPLARFLVGTGAAAFADAMVLTRAAVEFGFAGALVVPPFYFKNLTGDGVFRYYSQLIERVGDERLLLYLYHFPQLSGFGFSPSLVRRLASTFPAIIGGIKDSSGVPGYAESIAAACPALDVFPSSESELGANKARGFAGCISATLNVSAPLAGRVWNGAPDATGALGTIRATIAKYQLVPAIRAVMASLVEDDGWLRLMPPLIELAQSEADRLVAELDAVPEFSVIRNRYT